MRVSGRLLVTLSLLALGAGLANRAEAAGSLDTKTLQAEFREAASSFEGRVGVCAIDPAGKACFNGDHLFSLQSVMKLLVGMAVMDSVDNRGWRLDEPVTVTKQDLSLFVQPIAKMVAAQGSFQTTIGDLVRRAIVDSDSAAADILVKRLGGPQAVQTILDRKAIRDVRFDRDEKHLQTEIFGLTWKPGFVDADLLDRTMKTVPKDVREAAFRRYQTDVRDTATPLGMASLLRALAKNTILSAASCRHLLDVMTQTVTYPDRLKAGTAPGWTIAHKTGTSNTWNGVTVATNDVGILGAPDGGFVAIAVFIADARAPERDRAALTAKLAALTIQHYR